MSDCLLDFPIEKVTWNLSVLACTSLKYEHPSLPYSYHMGTPWPWTSPFDPQDLSKRVPLRSSPPTDLLKLVHCSPYIFRQVGSWPATERLHFGPVLLKIRFLKFDIILVISKSITSIQKCSEVVSLGSDLGRAHVLGVYGSKPILSSTILAQ